MVEEGATVCQVKTRRRVLAFVCEGMKRSRRLGRCLNLGNEEIKGKEKDSFDSSSCNEELASSLCCGV